MNTLAMIEQAEKAYKESEKELKAKEKLEILGLIQGMYNDLFDEGQEEEACKRCIKFMLKESLEVLKTNKLSDEELTKGYYLYEKAYAFSGRRSLEHFIDFMEWDRTSHNKVLANRREVLRPFIYYLNKMRLGNEIEMVVASYPPSAAKTFVVNYYTAWCMGVDIDSTFIRMSYSDDLVQKMSLQVQQIMLEKRYAMVFPQYSKVVGKVFQKSKVSDWSTRITSETINHIARTRDASVTGNRAKTAIILDDMTKGADESTNAELHKSMYDKWKTDWSSRIDGQNCKFVLVGTMWSPEDLLNKMYEETEMYFGGLVETGFKYTRISKDGKRVFIQVPLLDENDKSTLPQVYSDEKARFLRDTTDEYLFSCAYQQRPIAPTGLEFSMDNLNLYSSFPQNVSKIRYASLDPARKGKDFVSMPIFGRLEDNEELDRWCLVDVFYKKEAMSDCYDDIVAKCIKQGVKYLIIENNTDTSLAYVLENKFKEVKYDIEISEKYQTIKKETRIKDARGIIKKQLMFPNKNMYDRKSMMYDFMDTFTKYSFDYSNKHDDAPDSVALFVNEVVLNNINNNYAKVFNRNIFYV